MRVHLNTLDRIGYIPNVYKKYDGMHTYSCTLSQNTLTTTRRRMHGNWSIICSGGNNPNTRCNRVHRRCFRKFGRIRRWLKGTNMWLTIVLTHTDVWQTFESKSRRLIVDRLRLPLLLLLRNFDDREAPILPPLVDSSIYDAIGALNCASNRFFFKYMHHSLIRNINRPFPFPICRDDWDHERQRQPLSIL